VKTDAPILLEVALAAATATEEAIAGHGHRRKQVQQAQRVVILIHTVQDALPALGQRTEQWSSKR
jgi:hypothetical protein